MKKYQILFYFSLITTYGQSVTGNDLLSDLQNSNKNAVYTYWIGIVNGNIQGYEYGTWFVLEHMAKLDMITPEEKIKLMESLEIKLPDDADEEDIFKIVWKNISKNPERRHMHLSELTHIAIKEKATVTK